MTDPTKDLVNKRLLLDQTITEVRSKFADLTPDELEAMIAEAVMAARKLSTAGPGIGALSGI